MATPAMPSAEIVFDTMFAYQRSAALKSAIDLDVFTAIDGGATTFSALARECGTSDRGMRILCDYLSSIGLLTKSEVTYRLTLESAAFLSKRSPAYLGTTARFLLRPEMKRNFDNLTEAVRRGGVAPGAEVRSPPSEAITPQLEAAPLVESAPKATHGGGPAPTCAPSSSPARCQAPATSVAATIRAPAGRRPAARQRRCRDGQCRWPGVRARATSPQSSVVRSAIASSARVGVVMRQTPTRGVGAWSIAQDSERRPRNSG